MFGASISLCMVVKNEEEMLPEFLLRARGLYDELCVVDTGSEDRTVDLLIEAGAHLVSTPFEDDFAAVRNRSLELATGDWVLTLDPDEWVSPELVWEVRAVTRRAEVGAAAVLMTNETPDGQVQEAHLLRLFRKDPSITFRHPIHEDATESVMAFLKREGLKLEILQHPVSHLGYLKHRAGRKQKKARDVGLLLQCVHQNPRDFYAWFKLLEQARYWNDRALLEDVAKRFGPELLRDGTLDLKDKHYAGELIVLLAMGLARTPHEELKLLLSLEPHLSPSPPFMLRKAELFELTHQEEAALSAFQACTRLPPGSQRQFTTLRPLMGMSRLLMAGGRYEEALGLSREALAMAPRDAEALLATLLLERQLRGQAGVDAFREAYLEHYGQTTALLRALCEDAWRQRDWPGAVSLLQKADEAPIDGHFVLLLGLTHLLGSDLEALQAMVEQSREAFPSLSLLGAVGALLQNQPVNEVVPLSSDEVDDVMREIVRAMRHYAPQELMSRFVTLVPALEQSFPWLGAELDAMAPRR